MKAWLVGVALAFLVGAGLALAISNGLVYEQRDSPTYVSSAESLASGDGFRAEFGDPGKALVLDSTGADVVDFPPGYPLALSLGVRLGFDAEDVATALSVVTLVAITLVMFGLALSRGLGIIGSAVGALAGALISFPEGLAAQSEVLYGLMLVGGLVLVVRYAETKRPAVLVASVALAAGAVLVRTIGLALVATIAVVVWLARPPGRRRWLESIAVIVVGSLPFLFSTARGNRGLVWHPPVLEDLKEMAAAFSNWLLSPVEDPLLRVAVLSLAGAIGVYFWVRRRGDRQAEWSLAASGVTSQRWLPALLSAGLHFVLLLVTITLFDAQTSLTARLLYPVGLSLVIFGIELAATSEPTGTVRRVLGIVGVAALLSGLWVSTSEAIDVYQGDRDFGSPEFQNAETLDLVGEGVTEFVVFSNVPDGLWVVGISGAYSLPALESPLTDLSNDGLEGEIALVASEIQSGEAIAFFYKQHQRSYLLDLPTLETIAPCVAAEDEIGVVLVASSHPWCDPGSG